MSRIFIGHSSSDNVAALALSQWLAQRGWSDHFLDFDAERGLSPGQRWQAALAAAVNRCEAVIFLISPAWRDSRWCLAEFHQAKSLGKQIFGVLIEPTPLATLPQEMTIEWQLCNLVDGEERVRFQGVMPPVVRAPTFAIRKRASAIISLDAYVGSGVLTHGHARFLRDALHNLANILIAGPTSSGKTTLANALLAEIAMEEGERVILLEDTVELQCASADHVALRTTADVSMADLVRATLRLRPDRIVVGEVRGGEALDLLKAWGTGHPGGIATIHANAPQAALSRLEQLILESATTVPRALIADTVNVIVVIAGRGRQRKVERIVEVVGLTEHGYLFNEVHDVQGDSL